MILRIATAIAKSKPDTSPVVERRQGQNRNERSIAIGTEGRAFHRANCPKERGDGKPVAHLARRRRSPSNFTYSPNAGTCGRSPLQRLKQLTNRPAPNLPLGRRVR